jgi:hypothetical protein
MKHKLYGPAWRKEVCSQTKDAICDLYIEASKVRDEFYLTIQHNKAEIAELKQELEAKETEILRLSGLLPSDDEQQEINEP